MKNIIIILVIAMCLFGTMSMGYSKPKSDKIPNYPAKAIYKLINKSVSYPEFGYPKDISGDVDIIFALSAEGTIIIKRMTSENQELKKYVRELLSRLDFNQISYPIGQLYRVTLSFHPE